MIKKTTSAVFIIAFIISVWLVFSGICFSMGSLPKTKPDPTPTPAPISVEQTEYGDYSQSGNEVDFYFKKPMEFYGKFDLYLAGKVININGPYKKDNIEVRNANSTKNLVVITDITYAGKQAYIKYNAEGSSTPTPTPTPDIIESKDYSHINHRSWEGKGTSIIFCPGDRMSSVTFNGKPFHFHKLDRTDEGPGREIWTNHYFSGISENGTAGEFIWVDKFTGKKYKTYSDGRGDDLTGYLKHKGDCFGIYK